MSKFSASIGRSLLIILLCVFSFCIKESKIGKVKSFDDVEIAYSVYGSGDTTLVFVHGWCCDQTYWREQIQLFSQNYRLVTIDLAGHGLSGVNRTQWTMNSFGQDIKAVIEKLDLHNVILVPHSAGGFSSLEAARVLGDRIIAIIGIDAYRYINEGSFERKTSQERINSYGAAYKPDFAGPMKELVKSRFFAENADSSLVNWVAYDMASAPPEVAIPSMKAYYYFRNENFELAMRELGSKIPIIAINVEKSKVDLDYLKKYAPKFSVIYMSGVGHFLMLEDPENFNKIFCDAIKNISCLK